MENWKDGRKMVNIKCEHCGEYFDKTMSEYNRSNKKNRKHYCSLKCSYEYKKNNKIRKYCLFCGNKIEGTDNRIKFCNHSCAASYTNKIRTCKPKIISDEGMKNILNANKKRYNTDEYYKRPNKCKHCNKPLVFSKRKNIFCDKNCKKEYYRSFMSEYDRYKSNCRFNFNLKDYPNEFDFNLITEHGWYKPKNRGDNPNGVSRDHMYSIKNGFDNSIDPYYISHPANCRLMRHKDNNTKDTNSSITLEVLIDRVNAWDKKYK